MHTMTKIASIPILCGCLLMALSGCNSTSSEAPTNIAQHDGQSLFVSLAIPKALTGLPVSGLQAQVSFDGGIPIPLTVNADNTLNGTIEEVATGSHQLIITYFVLEGGVPITLASALMNIDVVGGGSTNVVVSESDLNRNIDSDLDGYTNLSEIRLGTRALDKFDSPGGESPLFVVSNASFGKSTSASYQIKYSLGAFANGSFDSTNYVLVSGFGNF